MENDKPPTEADLEKIFKLESFQEGPTVSHHDQLVADLIDDGVDARWLICRCSNLVTSEFILAQPLISDTGDPFLKVIGDPELESTLESALSSIMQRHLLGEVAEICSLEYQCQSTFPQDERELVLRIPSKFQYHPASKTYLATLFWAHTVITVMGYCDILTAKSEAGISVIISQIFQAVISMLPSPPGISHIREAGIIAVNTDIPRGWGKFRKKVHLTCTK